MCLPRRSPTCLLAGPRRKATSVLHGKSEMLRHVLVASCLGAALLACPRSAAAQRATFVQALIELTAAVEGTYGDEGSRITPALDKMSRALETWDREIAAVETSIPTDAASSPTLAEKHFALGQMYARRGRFSDALRHLDDASRLAPKRADVQLLRGLVLEILDATADATAAFRAAWTLDPADPVKAYYVFRHAQGSAADTLRRQAVDALATEYRRLLTDGSGKKGSPFSPISLLQDATGQMPLIPLAAYQTAYERIARGELEGGVAEFRKAAAVDPILTDATARSSSVMRAVAALRQGRLTTARTALEQSDALRDSSEAHRILGLVYWVESDYDRSIQQLEAAVRGSRRDERSRLALSRVLSTAGRDADAERVLEETIRELPHSARAHMWLATSYERSNRFADARHAFESAAARAISGQSQLYGSIGRLASAAADLSAASVAFAHAVATSPADAANHVYLAQALLLEDRTDEAFAEFVAALLIDARNAAAHAGIGQIELGRGAAAEAVDAFRRATELSPGNIEVQYALASALTRAGKVEEANQYFSRVEQAQHQMLAERRRTLTIDVLKEEAALRASEHDYDRAAALWEQVLTREPARASHHVGFGAVLASAGRIDSAIEQYEQAVTLGAEPTAYLQRADLYAKAGRVPDAARARLMYEKALQSDQAGGGAAR
jgi:tetratricopeptide (TPR) repeat protein